MQCLKPVFMSLFNVRPIVLSFGPGMRIANISKIAGDKSDSPQYQEDVSPHLGAGRSGVFEAAVVFHEKAPKKIGQSLARRFVPEKRCRRS